MSEGFKIVSWNYKSWIFKTKF